MRNAISGAKAVALALSLAIWSGAAQAQQNDAAQRQAAIQDLQRLVVGHRTLSGCPNLIEDWEYEAIDHVIAERTVQLTQGFVLPADVHWAWMMVGEAYGCDSPEAASFAGFYRRLARHSWLSWVQAFEGAPGCVHSAKETDRAGFAEFKQQATTPEAMTAAALAPLTAQDNQAIAAKAGGLIEWTNGFCGVADAGQSAPELWNRMATAVRAPLGQTFVLNAAQDRERSFNFTRGFTIGASDAFNASGRRWTALRAVRRAEAERSFVRADAMCGGKPPGATFFRGSVTCRVLLRPDGSLHLFVKGSDTPPRLDGAVVQVLDPETGAVLRSLPANVTDGNEGFTGQWAEATVAGVTDLLAASAGTFEHVHVALDLSMKRDGTVVKVAVPMDVDNPNSPRSLTAIDLLRAAAYTFAPQGTDLSMLNHAARKAAGGQ